MSDVESIILSALSSGADATIPDSFAFATTSKIDHNSIVEPGNPPPICPFSPTSYLRSHAFA